MLRLILVCFFAAACSAPLVQPAGEPDASTVPDAAATDAGGPDAGVDCSETDPVNGPVTSGPVGIACASDDDCTHPRTFCIEPEEGWRDGYCTAPCFFKECPVGSHCGRGPSCVANCVSDADCREGDGCVDFDGDCLRECVPAGVGAGSVGDACEDTGDCEGGVDAYCYLPSQLPDGYCSARCDGARSCPAGSHCGDRNSKGAGFCWQTCETDADCTREGYACRDPDADGVKECLPRPSTSGSVGDPCSSVADCGGESAACITESLSGFKDGSCTQRCGPGQPCPTGASCYSNWCYPSCTINADCRSDGYACHSGFSAETSPPSDGLCAPAGTGSTPVGGPCEHSFECSGGTMAYCVHVLVDEVYKNGYCALSMVDGCIEGTVGIGEGFNLVCGKSCEADDECREPAYECRQVGYDTTRFACQPTK